MRSRGTRVDDLTPEGKPGLYRIIRFGTFSTGEPSQEFPIDFNLKELKNLRDQIDAVLSEEAKEKEADHVK